MLRKTQFGWRIGGSNFNVTYSDREIELFLSWVCVGVKRTGFPIYFMVVNYKYKQEGR